MGETKHDDAIVRNSHPVERRTETISKDDVCNLSAFMLFIYLCNDIL